jgi:thiamine biosynthesis lipoprotein
MVSACVGPAERRVLVPARIAREAASAAPGQIQVLSGETMGTTWSVKLVHRDQDAARDLLPDIGRRLDLVVAQMSPWERSSALSRFNAAEPGQWCSLPAEMIHVLRVALDLARDTHGAFDPTIGALVDLWGFGPRSSQCRVPSPTEIRNAAAQCGWSSIGIDADRNRAWQPGGLRLDLCGIAKGFAVDLVARFLEEAGAGHFIVEIGGELRGRGVKPDGTPWWVAFEPSPPTAQGEPSEWLVALHELSIATSGDRWRSFMSEGKCYAHTIDPRTGCPAGHDLSSVTVLHQSCMMADALATALTVLGPGAGMTYARDRGIAARFVVRGSGGVQELATPSLLAMLQ